MTKKKHHVSHPINCLHRHHRQTCSFSPPPLLKSRRFHRLRLRSGQPSPHLRLPPPPPGRIIRPPRILPPPQCLPRCLRAADHPRGQPRPRRPGPRDAADRRRAAVRVGVADGHGDQVRGRGGYVGEGGEEAEFVGGRGGKGGGFETCEFASFFHSLLMGGREREKRVSHSQKPRKITLLTHPLSNKAFKALQTAYIRLLQNPFYTPSAGPDEQHHAGGSRGGNNKSGEITSPKFIAEVRRIGEVWRPGMERV